ncbi:MAG: hypothetical protein WCQ50_11135 [Spirochaetota bacterium]
MISVLEIASIVLFAAVGIICLFMAYATMFARRYLPFHEEGAGMKWEEHSPNLQATILTLVNLSGLGFLIVGLMLIVLPILNRYDHSLVLAVSIPVLALVFCAGLGYFNFQLHKKTKADTPWQGSIAAMALITLALVLSLLK